MTNNNNWIIFLIIWVIAIITLIIILNSFLFNNIKKLNNIVVFHTPNESFGGCLRAIFYCILIFSILLLFNCIKRTYLNYYFLKTYNDLLLDNNFLGVINVDFSIFWNVVFVCLFLVFVICFELTYSYYLKINKNKKINSFKNFSDLLIILFFYLFGSIIILSSTSLLYIYLGLEIVALSIVILTASRLKAPLASEAAIKYLVLASISSGFFLLGSSFLYILFGSLDIIEIFNLILVMDKKIFVEQISPIYYLGSIFIIISILFKLGAAPFHNWVPDLYNGSNIPYVGVYSTLSKFVYILLLIKINYFLNFRDSMIFFEIYISDIIMLISFLSLLIGSLGALVQLKIKRFLGYSTISHIGYMLLPLLSTDYTHIIPTIFLYLLNYILIMIQILTILIVVFSITGNFIAGKLKGMRFTVYNKSMVWFCFFWSVAFLSLAGLPPFSGFWVKIQLLRCFICDGHNIFYSVLILLISSLSIFYYLRFIVYSFVLPTVGGCPRKRHWLNFNEKNNNSILYYLIIMLFLFNILFGMYCDILYEFLYKICYDEYFWKLNVFYNFQKI